VRKRVAYLRSLIHERARIGVLALAHRRAAIISRRDAGAPHRRVAPVTVAVRRRSPAAYRVFFGAGLDSLPTCRRPRG